LYVESSRLRGGAEDAYFLSREWDGKLPREEMEAFAERQRHPFYRSYVKASENEKADINTQIHNSIDYRPAQYWFNAVFLWFICFTTIWFFGLMTQGVINLVRQKPDLIK
jgi:hypothetical protein